jgi:hypothetical protein
MVFEDAIEDPGTSAWYRVVLLLHGDAVRSSAAIAVETPALAARPAHLEIRATRAGGEGVEIRYAIPRGSMDLAVYSVNGRRVRRLESGARPAGEYTSIWNHTDDRGDRVARGVYMVRLITNGQELSKKVVVARD